MVQPLSIPNPRLILGLLLALLIPYPTHALNWISLPTHRQAPLPPPPSIPIPAGFKLIPPDQSQVLFTNALSETRSITNQIYLNGSGIAIGDVDGDTYPDLYFCGLDSPNRLYRNLQNGTFLDITPSSQTACADQASTGCVLADIDGDHDLDLLVNGLFRGTRLFLNDGHARFTEATASSGLGSPFGTTSFALADINHDSLLDLYVVNYRNDTIRDIPNLEFTVQRQNGIPQLLTFNGIPATHPSLQGRFTFDQNQGVLENGDPDLLYLNLGNGKFKLLSWTDGTFLDEQGKPASIPYDWGLSASFRDINHDLHPDLLVCNDFQSPDRFWINRGDGTFQALSNDALRQTSLFSMGLDVADINRDGHDDLFFADMLSRDPIQRLIQVMAPTAFAQVRNPSDPRPQSSRNTLFLNRGDHSYAEIARFAGLDASDWSWCPIFLDIDLDGYEDLLVTTGHWRDAQNADIAAEIDRANQQQKLTPQQQLAQRKRFPPLLTPNLAFRNNGNLTFEEIGASWGFHSTAISQGMALGDLDLDGDLDIVVNCLNAPGQIYQNLSTAPRIAVQLKGNNKNKHGIGARITVLAQGLPPQHQEIQSGGRYLSSDQALRTFATGSQARSVEIQVHWPSGALTHLKNCPVNHYYEIPEPTHPGTPSPAQPQLPTQWEDLSQNLKHQHTAPQGNDFTQNPLLPLSLSDFGPGIACYDFNGDGWEDLLIGTGSGARLGVYRNGKQENFIPQRAQLLEAPAPANIHPLLVYSPTPSTLSLLLGYSTPFATPPGLPPLREYSLNTGAKKDHPLPNTPNPSILALADIDLDGDLDLFVGGYHHPNQYPTPNSGTLLLAQQGNLTPSHEHSLPFQSIGLITSAQFLHFNDDPWPDLLLTRHWNAPLLFLNHQGTFQPTNPPIIGNPEFSTLQTLTGLWNSLTTGDFNNDGRTDIVLGNWGRNTHRQKFHPHPTRLYHSRKLTPEIPLLLEAQYLPSHNNWYPQHPWSQLTPILPQLQITYSNFSTFAHTPIPSLLETLASPQMEYLEFKTTESILLLNLPDTLHYRALPPAAQFSPLFGLASGDGDGDGQMDLFLSQNQFLTPPDQSRQDAGRGLWLKGNGQGDFQPRDASQSGIRWTGQGRALATADLNRDGRLDLVATQYGQSTQVLFNRLATPGLLLQLKGKGNNPKAVGTRIRAEYQNGTYGPQIEIQLGGGYATQSSLTPLIPAPHPLKNLHIQWPTGKEQTLPISQATSTTLTITEL